MTLLGSINTTGAVASKNQYPGAVPLIARGEVTISQGRGDSTETISAQPVYVIWIINSSPVTTGASTIGVGVGTTTIGVFLFQQPATTTVLNAIIDIIYFIGMYLKNKALNL